MQQLQRVILIAQSINSLLTDIATSHSTNAWQKLERKYKIKIDKKVLHKFFDRETAGGPLGNRVSSHPKTRRPLINEHFT